MRNGWQEELPLTALIRDSRVQPREAINATVVSEYAIAMAKIPVIEDAGLSVDHFPPIKVFCEEKDGTRFYWLADGWHRVLAAEEKGDATILADVAAGDVYAAIMYAAGSNAAHGLRRTNRDKHRAVRMLLDHPTVIREQWSDVRVSVQAGVGTTMVGIVRKEREQELGLPPSTERRGQDGKLYGIRTREEKDVSQTPSTSSQGVSAATATVDASEASLTLHVPSGDGKLLIHQCETEGCDAVTTDPSWHCGICGKHWPMFAYAPGSCPDCLGDEEPRHPATVMATLTSVETTGGNVAGQRTTQVPYTPGTMKASGATLAYERLVSALELIESLSGMDAGAIMAESPDPNGLRRQLSRTREFLLSLSASSLGVRAL